MLITQEYGVTDEMYEDKKSIIEKDGTYCYYAHLKSTNIDVKKINWAISYDGNNVNKSYKLFSGGHIKNGKLEVKIQTKKAKEKFKIYAYTGEVPKENLSVNVLIEQKVILPLFIDRYKKVGYNIEGNKLANDLHYGNGIDLNTGHSLYSINDVMGIHSVFKPALKYPNKFLWNSFEDLITYACFGELNNVALEIVKHFKSNTGNDFTNKVLTKHVKSHPSTLRFCKSMEELIKLRLKKNNYNFSKISYKEINKGDDTPRKIDEEWGHPRLDHKKGKDSLIDYFKSFSGLYMIMHDIWAHEVFISDVIKTKKEISITYTVILYDHFGLDINDICCEKSERSLLIGFRAWFILQHVRDFKPFVTKVEFNKTIKINL